MCKLKHVCTWCLHRSAEEVVSKLGIRNCVRIQIKVYTLRTPAPPNRVLRPVNVENKYLDKFHTHHCYCNDRLCDSSATKLQNGLGCVFSVCFTLYFKVIFNTVTNHVTSFKNVKTYRTDCNVAEDVLRVH